MQKRNGRKTKRRKINLLYNINMETKEYVTEYINLIYKSFDNEFLKHMTQDEINDIKSFICDIIFAMKNENIKYQLINLNKIKDMNFDNSISILEMSVDNVTFSICQKIILISINSQQTLITRIENNEIQFVEIIESSNIKTSIKEFKSLSCWPCGHFITNENGKYEIYENSLWNIKHNDKSII